MVDFQASLMFDYRRVMPHFSEKKGTLSMQDYNTFFSHSVLDSMKNHDWEHILPEGIQSDFVAIFLYISGIHNFPRLGTFFFT